MEPTLTIQSIDTRPRFHTILFHPLFLPAGMCCEGVLRLGVSSETPHVHQHWRYTRSLNSSVRTKRGYTVCVSVISQCVSAQNYILYIPPAHTPHFSHSQNDLGNNIMRDGNTNAVVSSNSMHINWYTSNRQLHGVGGPSGWMWCSFRAIAHITCEVKLLL